MTTGQKIIQNQQISFSEADSIFRDLNELGRFGVWGSPDNETEVWRPPSWACDLADHYKVPTACSSIQIAGWEAIARFYKNAFDRKLWNSLGE